MRLDFFASQPHYVDHLAVVWHALPPELRGSFYASSSGAVGSALERATVLGVSAAHERMMERTHANGPVLVAAPGDLVRVKSRPVAYMPHGLGQFYAGEHGSHPANERWVNVDLMLAPSEWVAGAFRQVWPELRIEVVGSPRLDQWVGSTTANGRPVVALGGHWDQPTVPEMLGCWDTYRDAWLGLRDSYTLLGHGHPRLLAGTAHAWYRRNNVPTARHFNEVLQRADVYIADNTSTLYEFAATGRPVVVLNAPWYRRDVEHGGRFWRWADVGVQVDTPADLPGAVAAALADAPAQRARRAAVTAEAYANLGHATSAAVAALSAWLSAGAPRNAGMGGRAQPLVRALPQPRYTAQPLAATPDVQPPGARVVLLVPWRGGDVERERAWMWAGARWQQQTGWPIYTGDTNDPIFNRAGARNAAALAAGDWDVAVITDADTVVRDVAQIVSAARHALAAGCVVIPHDEVVRLTAPASRRLLRGDRLQSTWTRGRRYHTSAGGGVVVVARRAWDAMGGYDERFRGWGGEDSAFMYHALALGRLQRRKGTIYCLWHEPERPQAERTPEYARNAQLSASYARARHDPSLLPALLAGRQPAGVAV